jgi:hypothetical protein
MAAKRICKRCGGPVYNGSYCGMECRRLNNNYRVNAANAAKRQRLIDALAQRDEALAALRELEAVTSHYPQCPSRAACVCGLAKAKEAARTILAKYEGRAILAKYPEPEPEPGQGVSNG